MSDRLEGEARGNVRHPRLIPSPVDSLERRSNSRALRSSAVAATPVTCFGARTAVFCVTSPPGYRVPRGPAWPLATVVANGITRVAPVLPSCATATARTPSASAVPRRRDVSRRQFVSLNHSSHCMERLTIRISTSGLSLLSTLALSICCTTPMPLTTRPARPREEKTEGQCPIAVSDGARIFSLSAKGTGGKGACAYRRQCACRQGVASRRW